jgi:transposase
LTTAKATTTRYPQEQRERAVRMVAEQRKEYPSEWAAISSLAGKFGMTPETLRKWVRRTEVDAGRRPGVSSAERERVLELERENRELRRADEILRAASAFFARELDPRPPRW